MSKKIFWDFSLNIIASGIKTVGLQLVTYPILARMYTSDYYGVILTQMGICNTITVTFGNALNNVRLIQNERYKKCNQEGDFNLFVILACVLAALTSGVSSWLIAKDILIAVCLMFVNILGVIRTYYEVGPRLELKYTKVLRGNVLTALGYIVGTFLLKFGFSWPMAFLLGELLGSLYLLNASHLVHERLYRTTMFYQTGKAYLYLLLSTGIANITTYLDRFFLYPIMGSAAVSTYTVASIVGKCIGIIATPVAGVLLSYYAQSNYQMSSGKYYSQSIFMGGIALIFIIGIAPFSPFITKILYPTLFEGASRYIFWANTAAVIGTLGGMFSPAILKFVEPYWQIFITALYSVVYLVSAYILTTEFGLIGFCAAAIIANGSKCGLLLLLGKRIDNEREDIL